MTERNDRKMRVGKVVSNKAEKSVVVLVDRQVVHPKYKRFMRRSKRCMAHDEKNECNVGDTVRIVETRPLSRTKRWRIEQIVTRAK
jgi:small subunit ribosomal protein S17